MLVYSVSYKNYLIVRKGKIGTAELSQIQIPVKRTFCMQDSHSYLTAKLQFCNLFKSVIKFGGHETQLQVTDETFDTFYLGSAQKERSSGRIQRGWPALSTCVGRLPTLDHGSRLFPVRQYYCFSDRRYI